MKEALSEEQRNIKVLRMHAGICSNAVKVEIEGPALKEQAKIFNGAADTIQRLTRDLKAAQRGARRWEKAFNQAWAQVPGSKSGPKPQLYVSHPDGSYSKWPQELETEGSTT